MNDQQRQRMLDHGGEQCTQCGRQDYENNMTATASGIYCEDCVLNLRADLQAALTNAEETLADALDDTSCLGPAEIAEARRNVVEARQALAAYTPATATLDITDNGEDFQRWTREHGISYKIVCPCFNGWTAEFHGTRLALEQMVESWWSEPIYRHAIRDEVGQ